MKIWFRGKTNDQDVWIKEIAFNLTSGSTVILNRNITQYTVEDDIVTMTWGGCYIFEGKRKTYSIKAADFKGAEIAYVTVSDDAPKGYQIHILEWRTTE